MQKQKLKLAFGFPAYGGNGGIASEVPDIRRWWAETIQWMAGDDRIHDWVDITLSDTPITMVRNRFVLEARKAKADVLVMVDSDQHPSHHLGLPDFRPFMPSSFDFLYDHWAKGPVMIGAPYCGPPPHENVYVFRFDNYKERGDETAFMLDKYTRHEASRMRGIQNCGALPTGLIMTDMRLFEICEPSKLSKREVLAKLLAGELTVEQAERELTEGWFYYEWTDGYAAEKASTEDVTATRDLCLAGIQELGYNPMFCNWDSPIGHWKPWCVDGRPPIYTEDNVGLTLRRAANRATSALVRKNFRSPMLDLLEKQDGQEKAFGRPAVDRAPEAAGCPDDPGVGSRRGSDAKDALHEPAGQQVPVGSNGCQFP